MTQLASDPPPAALDPSRFRAFLRSAGKLAVARQLSGLALVAAVLALPALTTRATSTNFVWAYFAMLTLTSLLGFGLERLAGTVSAERGDASLCRALAPVLAARVYTLPLAALSLWAFLAFVSVHLSLAAWCATLVWITAGLVAPLVFAALRVVGNSSAEPIVMVSMRIAQASALVGLAAAGAGVSGMVWIVALLEVAGLLCGFRGVGSARDLRGGFAGVPSLPLRRGAILAGIDVIGLLNLRADLLLVGRILGAGPGAVYGLLYRVVDAFSGLVGSAGLWLYAESANGNDGGEDGAGIRARSLLLLPRVGVALGLLVVLGAGPFGALVPQLSHEIGTLRVLVIAFPLLTVNSIELHVRSGRGRNREVLAINVAALVSNVVICVALLPTVGLVGGALALAASECLQAALLVVTASSSERALVGPALATAVAGALALALTGIALETGSVAVTTAGVLLTGVVVLIGMPWARVRRLLAT
jgi:O-antigen/teichoic acid export membrane protein